MAPSETTDAAPGDVDADPTARVHHHARTEGAAVFPVTTLCGIVLEGPREGASRMPCCPMCGAEMEALGRRCTAGP